jgi:hypothetical protein
MDAVAAEIGRSASIVAEIERNRVVSICRGFVMHRKFPPTSSGK